MMKSNVAGKRGKRKSDTELDFFWHMLSEIQGKGALSVAALQTTGRQREYHVMGSMKDRTNARTKKKRCAGRSSRGPGHWSAAEDMHVNMKNELSSVCTVVENDPETIADTIFC